MKFLPYFLLAIAVCFAEEAEEGSGEDADFEAVEEQPYTGPPVVVEDTIELTVGDEPVHISSPNYPEDAPAGLQRTWDFKTSDDAVINVECQDLRLFISEPCGAWALVLKEGEETSEVCVQSQEWTTTSKGNTLTLFLRTGEYARGFLDCKVKAIPKA